MSNRVLVIDDDENLVMALSDALEFEGYKTTSVTSPLDGLREICRTLPDIVICDWQMPDLNGRELLRIVQSNDGTKHVPFIIITSQTIFETEVKPAIIVTKPFTIDTLMDAIRQCDFLCA